MKRAKQAILPSRRRYHEFIRLPLYARLKILDMEIGVVEGVRFVETELPRLFMGLDRS